MLNGPNATVHHTNGIQNHRAITALVGLTGNFDRAGGNYVVPPTYLYVASGVLTRQQEFEQSRPWEKMPPRIGQDRYPVWCRLIPEAQAIHLPFQIRSRKPYPVRAVLSFGMNHRMWPGSDFMRDSLKMLDFFVDVDLFMTDTARLADVVLPACSSFERSELKFYPEQYVIWTHPVIKPLGQSRPDVDIILDLASRLTPGDSLMKQGYEACVDWILAPSSLKVSDLRKYPGGYPLKDVRMPPYEKYEHTGFSTPSGKMEFASTILKDAGLDPLPRYQEPKLSQHSTPQVARKFPLILTTGARLPMYVHSRTFRLPWIRRLRPDPMVDINPIDAEARCVSQDDRVELSTQRGSIRVKANLTEVVPPGTVNIYHGYPGADINQLIEPDYLDPISGYPGFKSLLCEVTKTP
jgi:anaerobic selenocysteine-containing dehydrogenase